MPAGRPKKKKSEETTTTVTLDKEARLAIKRLQLRREEQDRSTTMHDLLLEGLALLLAQEGLPPMAQPQMLPTAAIIEMTKR